MVRTYGTVVIGAGPAGCTAALYAQRASLRTLLVECALPGGQMTTTDLIENYPGFPSVSGAELGMKMQEQAEGSGVEMAYGQVQRLVPLDDGGFLLDIDGEEVGASSVVAAMGAHPRKAGFEGEERFTGRGVSYCATCDALFFRDKHVFVVGGGNSACEEALYLSHVARTVEIIVRRDVFRAPRGMVDRVLSQGNIKVRYQTAIAKVEGERFASTLTFKDTATGLCHSETYQEGSFGIFVFVGHEPVTGLLKGMVECGPDGGVLTTDAMETRTPGLFCAGDMRSKPVRQVVTAAADGAIAGLSAYRYVEALGAL